MTLNISYDTWRDNCSCKIDQIMDKELALTFVESGVCLNHEFGGAVLGRTPFAPPVLEPMLFIYIFGDALSHVGVCWMLFDL